MNYLPSGMHMRIRTPGADHRDRMICNESERRLDYCLHRDPVRLPLPSVVAGTVIFDATDDSHAQSPFSQLRHYLSLR